MLVFFLNERFCYIFHADKLRQSRTNISSLMNLIGNH